jgi:hypothetical protein
MNDTHLANDVGRDPAFDSGDPRSDFQEVFSWRVPNTAAYGGGACAANVPQQPGPNPGESPVTQVSSHLRIVSRRARISRKGVAAVRVRCLSKAICRGRLDLYRFIGTGERPAVRVTVGARRFRLAGGRTASVGVHIRRTQRRLARERGRLCVVGVGRARFASGGRGRAMRKLRLFPSKRRAGAARQSRASTFCAT